MFFMVGILCLDGSIRKIRIDGQTLTAIAGTCKATMLQLQALPNERKRARLHCGAIPLLFEIFGQLW